jgi:hypothetical protein
MASVRKATNRPKRKDRRKANRSVPVPTADVDGQVMLDEPALLGAGENPETDLSATALSHPIVDRPSSVESDAAASAMDDALPGTVSADPNVPSERGARSETAEDLH